MLDFRLLKEIFASAPKGKLAPRKHSNITHFLREIEVKSIIYLSPKSRLTDVLIRVVSIVFLDVG